MQNILPDSKLVLLLTILRVLLLVSDSWPFRRAHLKECFETLKKNVPNVDEKKTSNLSVLRSALRYIQVELEYIFSAFPTW